MIPIRFQEPSLPSLDAVSDYFASSEVAGQYSNFGPCHERFLRRLSSVLGNDCLVLTSNATMALQICMSYSAAERPGRSLVAMPSFTFAAAASAARMTGLTPIFVDIDEKSWQMDPESLRAALATAPNEFAAVVACSAFGTPAPRQTQEAWLDAARESGAQLIVDSAAGFGASNEQGWIAGSGRYLEIFSLHATKPLAIGEGGIIATPNHEMAENIRRMTNFGFAPGERTSRSLGTNAKLPEILCATGLAALDRFDNDIQHRRSMAATYKRFLRGSPYTFQEGSSGAVWQFVPLLSPSNRDRDEALAALKRANIEARTYYEPLHLFPAFMGSTDSRVVTLSVTENVADRILSLPMSAHLTEEEVAAVCRTILSKA